MYLSSSYLRIAFQFPENKTFPGRFDKSLIGNTYQTSRETLSNLPGTLANLLGGCYLIYQPHFEQSDWSIHYKHVRTRLFTLLSIGCISTGSE